MNENILPKKILKNRSRRKIFKNVEFVIETLYFFPLKMFSSLLLFILIHVLIDFSFYSVTEYVIAFLIYVISMMFSASEFLPEKQIIEDTEHNPKLLQNPKCLCSKGNWCEQLDIIDGSRFGSLNLGKMSYEHIL